MSSTTTYTGVDHVIYKCGPSTGHAMMVVAICTTPEIAEHFMLMLTVTRQAAEKKVNTPQLARETLKLMGITDAT